MGMGGQRHGPAALAPGKSSGTHCTGGCVDPSAGLDRNEKQKYILPHRGSNNRSYISRSTCMGFRIVRRR